MTKAGFCKLCSYFSRAKWNEDLFKEQVARGKSLRALRMLLLGMGLKVSEKTISSHFTHMGSQILQQRKHETSVKKKVSNPFRKLSKFFMKTSQLPTTSDCEHKRTRYSFNHNYSTKTSDGLVHVICLDCGTIVSKFDPEQNERRMRKDPRNLVIYESLVRRRRK